MARDRASSDVAKPLRLFVAADVPEDVKGGLAERVAPFRGRIPGARWTNPSGWHVTLKFLGTTWPRLVPTVEEAVVAAATRVASFGSALTEVGAFPSGRRARVLWAGLADSDGRFGELVKILDHLLAEYFVPERRAFTPHLTLARLTPPRDVDEVAPGLLGMPVASEAFPVDALTLYRSHLSPKGATYEALVRRPLST